MAKIYLAGPMSGYDQSNFPAFDAAATVLREQGIDVISPAELDDPEIRVAAMANRPTNQTWGDFLARDVKIVADHVDGVAMLAGWERSKGAKLEVTVALLAGKSIYQYHTQSGLTQLDRQWVKDVLYANL